MKRYSNYVALCVAALVLPLLFVQTSAGSDPDALPPARWSRDLPSSACPGGDPNCHRSSPALADINNDGRDEIILATHAGHIMAIRDNGGSSQVLFNVDVGPLSGMSNNANIISSSPAVADIDNDGQVEIVVGFGYEVTSTTRGGVIVLEHTGAVKPGWPKMSEGLHGNGNPRSVVSTPALGDLDKDGDLEIVVGGLDKRIYVFNHNGSTFNSNWPADSYLTGRFPTWPNLRGQLADSVWSAPALADVDGDGYLDIIIGTDEGNFDARYGGDSGGWDCPYTLPAGTAPGYCGGSLYVLDRFANNLPGFPRYIYEIIQSSPLAYDIDGDNKAEIFVGTGAYYWQQSPDRPNAGFRFYGFDHNGNDLPGWGGGKALGGVSPSSPVIGDIAGDGAPEIMIPALDGRIYAYHLNGQTVSGFPSRPLSRTGGNNGFDVGRSLLLADYDNDGKQEIFAPVQESVVIINGNGSQMTSSNNGGDGKPVFATGGWLINTPALGDTDGDNNLELIAHDSRLFVWDLSVSANGSHSWPMFRLNPARTGAIASPGALGLVPEEVGIMCQSGTSCNASSTLAAENGGSTTLSYSLNTGSTSGRVNFTSTNGSIGPGGAALIDFNVNTNGLGVGWHNLGSVTIATTNQAGTPTGNATIDLWFFRGNLDNSLMPAGFGGG